jgi:class 3 adenylate cyclase
MTLPTGPAVTFVFTDIEGSTRLERAVGSAAWAALVRRHDDLIRAAIEAQDGVVVKTEGDAFFAAFAAPIDAITAAAAAQRAIATEPWPDGAIVRVRMGLHLGEGRLRVAHAPGEPEDYVGIDVNYAARIAAAGNGGQIVLSDALVATLPRGLTRLAGQLASHFSSQLTNSSRRLSVCAVQMKVSLFSSIKLRVAPVRVSTSITRSR